MTLTEFARQSEFDLVRVANALDTLVQVHIFMSGMSYHASDIGEIVYAFDATQEAQRAFRIAKQKDGDTG